jgi:RES domain-containing protein
VRRRPIRYLTLCARFSRDVYLHAPADEPFELARLIQEDEPERWSRPGQPTIYLAGDPGVALAELGRHVPRLPEVAVDRRRILRVHVSLDRVLDLTRDEVLRAMGIENGALDLLDRDRTRELATDARESGDCDAIFVPSVAFLDQPDRWNLVVFAERLNGTVDGAVGPPLEVGRIALGTRDDRVGMGATNGGGPDD